MRYVILSTDDNPRYTVYKNLVDLMWRVFEWEPVWVEPITCIGLTSATRAQLARLYACTNESFKHNDYLLTSDADMIPLSAYWNPHEDSTITTWGRDLTDYHYPICYIGGSVIDWIDVMQIDKSILIEKHVWRDINDKLMRRTSPWCLDQDIITHKLHNYGIESIEHVDRGIDTETRYPIGRLDRSAWRFHPENHYTDCHLPHDFATNEKSRRQVEELYNFLKRKHNLKPTLAELC